MNDRRWRWGFTAALALSAALTLQAQAGECPRKDALGTSRVIAVDAATTPRVGLKSFPQTLALQDREVVLTFDDGPLPAADEAILAALAEECVHATFFLIGQPASEHPELVRRMAAEGHTVAHHSWSHPILKQMTPEEAADDIDKGFAAIETVLNGAPTTTPSTPFFRYPFFEMTQPTLDDLEKRGIVVFGTDFWADDWLNMTPEAQLKRLIDSLEAAKKGILLLHSRTQTAAVLPAFLRYLRDNGYSVVHVVPATATKTTAAALPKKQVIQQLMRHSSSGLQ